jgi:hypothetical protein
MNKPIPLRADPDAARIKAVNSLARAAIAAGLGKLDGNIKPSDYWGDDRDVELVLRAAVSPTAVSNSPALSQIAVAFLETLVPASAGAALLGRGIGLSFAGAAQINVPTIAVPTADFVGEMAPIPVRTAPTTAGPTLLPHKLAVIAVLTGEIMRSANAETLVRQALIESTGPAIDKVLFSTAAAAADRPAGLMNGIAPLTPAAAGAKEQAIVDDLQTLAGAVAPVAGNSDIVIVAAPAQAVALALRMPARLSWPVLISASLTAGTVIAVAANAIVSAVDGVPQIDARREVGLNLADPAAELVNVSGVYAQPIGSTFQTDEVALRLRWPISWALRKSTGLAWMQNVNW